MAIAQNQFTITCINDGAPGDPGVYITTVTKQYFLSTETTELLPKKPEIITFDDNAKIIIGKWIDINEGDTLPIAKGFINGEEEFYIIFRREKYTWSDGSVTVSVASLHESDQRIVQWCSTSNKTYFDGSKIYAGSVHAEQIDSNAITTDKIAAEAITAEKIKANTITANQIAADTITAAQIAADAITADKLNTDAITSRNYYEKNDKGEYIEDKDGQLIETGQGSKLDLEYGTWDSAHFEINGKGEIIATGGNIGGWYIDEDFLKSKDGQIALYSEDQKNDVVVAGRTAKDWRIVSPNFGVTDNGTVYATNGSFTGYINAAGGGNIGGLTIQGNHLMRLSGSDAVSFFSGDCSQGVPRSVGDSGLKQDWFIWARKDDPNKKTEGYFGVDSEGKLYADEGRFSGHIQATSGSFTGHVEATSGSFANQAESSLVNKSLVTHENLVAQDYYPLYRIAKTSEMMNGETKVLFNDLPIGTKFVLSYKFQTKLGTSPTVGGSLIGMEIKSCEIDGAARLASSYSSAGLEVSGETEHTVVLELEVTSEDAAIGINVAGTIDSETEGFAYELWDIKIEEGAGVNGDYSWSFSPEEGMQMWNGPVSATPVLKVDSEGLHIKGNGEFTGDITASTITGSTFTNDDGTFEIDSNGNITGSTITGSIFANDDESFKIDGEGNISGAKITGSSIEVKDGDMVNFSVTDDGKLTAKDADISGTITATGGEIGGWYIDQEALRDKDSKIVLDPSGKFSLTKTDGSVLGELTFKAGSNFGVTTDGKLYATEADIEGKIVATSGKIGGLTIDDIERGKNAQNLFLYTEELPIADNIESGIYSWSGDGLSNTENGLKLEITNDLGNQSVWVPLVEPGIINNNDKVTLSFDYRGNFSTFGILYITYTNGSTKSLGDMGWAMTASDTAWNHFSQTFSSDSFNPEGKQCKALLMFYNHRVGENNIDKPWLEIKNKSLKLEIGNKETPWCPAQKELSTTAELNVLRNSVVAKVSNESGANCSWNLTTDEFRVTATSAKGNKGEIVVNEEGLSVTGNLEATGGDIGGWTIGEDLRSDEQGTIILDPIGRAQIPGKVTGLVFKAGDNFGVTKEGNLYATGADIEGKIVATEGNIAGWTLRDTSLISGNATSGTVIGLFTNYKGLPTSSENSTLTKEYAAVGDANKNDWRILIGNNGVFNFGVDSTGILHAKGADISGTITASKITGSTFTNNSESFKIDSDGNITGSKISGSSIEIKEGDTTNFSVTDRGELTAKKGNIASWALRDTSLISGYHGGTVMGLFTNYQGIPTTNGNTALGNTSLSVAGSQAKDNWRILVGSGGTYNFGVDSSGILYAKGADISGKITAESGKIAGWEIQNDPTNGKTPAIFYGAFGSSDSFHMYADDKEGTLYRTDLNGNDIFRVWKDNWRLTIGNNFGVTSDGEIHAYKGSLAGIDISGDNLTWSNEKGELVSLISGVLRQGTARPVGDSGNKNDWFLWTGGKFGVDAAGRLYAIGGKIGGWEITESGIEKRNEEGTPMVGVVSGDEVWEALSKGDVAMNTIEGQFEPSIGTQETYLIQDENEYAQLIDFQYNLSGGVQNNYCYAQVVDGKIKINYMFVGTSTSKPILSYTIKAKYYTYKSAIRFHAGPQILEKINRKEVITFPTYNGMWKKTVLLTEQQRQDQFFIESVKCLTTTEPHSTEQIIQVTVKTEETYYGAYYPIVEGKSAEISFEHVPINDNVELELVEGAHPSLELTYDGNGKISLGGGLGIPGDHSFKNVEVVLKIRCTYTYNEELNVTTSITDNALGVTCELKPGNSEESYSIEIEYVIAPRNKYDYIFKILEDGSLYAAAARIQGHIDATSGSFSGEVYANKGRFGVLEIFNNTIATTSSNLMFTSEGTIIADRLQLNQQLYTTELKAGKISGRNTGSPYFLLEGNTTDTDTVEIQATTTVINQGERNFWGIQDAGEVRVTVTSSHPLVYEREFVVTVHYVDGEYGHKADKKTIKIAQNSSSGSTTFINLMDWTESWGHARVSFEASVDTAATTVTPTSFTQPSTSTVSSIISSSSLTPLNSELKLGSISAPWKQLFVAEAYITKGWISDTYSSSGTQITSDINKKNTIQNIDEKYSKLFDYMRPVTFKLNEDTTSRLHIGFIAQELKNSMSKCEITDQEFAAYCTWEDFNGKDTCGIRYTEIIPLNTWQIQKLKPRMASAEEKLLAYESRISALEKEIENLKKS